MFKKILILFALLTFTAASVIPAFAAQGPEGNNRKGKYTYRKVYKACAQAGGVASETPTLSPADKTQAEWKAVFENKALDEFGCADHWTQLSDEDLLDIYSYFYHHASDSPTPATCK